MGLVFWRQSLSIWWCLLQCHLMDGLIQLSMCPSYMEEESSGMVGKNMIIFILRQQYFYYMLEQMMINDKLLLSDGFLDDDKKKSYQKTYSDLLFFSPSICFVCHGKSPKAVIIVLLSWTQRTTWFEHIVGNDRRVDRRNFAAIIGQCLTVHTPVLWWNPLSMILINHPHNICNKVIKMFYTLVLDKIMFTKCFLII